MYKIGENASCTMFVELNSQRFPLELGQIYLLGKQLSTAEADIKKCINLRESDDVDQKHCVLEVGVGEDVYIFDLFSSNGTYLNNIRLKALEKTLLKNGDILKVGLEQQVKFYHEQPEMSHDSSGFLDVNKNTSDIIASSPESISQREIRAKRFNNNNFLIPAVPTQKHTTPNTSLFIPENEKNTSNNSINNSINSRRSDSFIIPETQFCKSRSSINTAELSIAESNPDVNVSKIKFNYMNDDNDDDDDFCIPETQEAMMVPICNQRPRLLIDDNKHKERGILEEKSVDLSDEDSLDTSRFRICTQDYNEGFGEIEEEGLTSQIIPIIKHNKLLSNSQKSDKETKNDQLKLARDEKEEENYTKEMSDLQWNDIKLDQVSTEIRASCATPDIFDFDYLDQAVDQNLLEVQPVAAAATVSKDNVTNKNILESDPIAFEDEEDLMPTQILPSNITKTTSSVKNVLNEKEKPCMEKEQEHIFTFSDKENRHPDDLEPIADLPPTQLLAVKEASSARSSVSTSSRKTSASKSEEVLNLNPSTSNVVQCNKSLNLDYDEEDDRLTQAFPQPTKPISITTANTLLPKIYLNSTLLDDKVLSNKNPSAFFADMEKSPLKNTKSPGNIFKMPERDFSRLRKISSAASINSESDLDLLMCTPQLIKDHIQVGQSDEFKKSLLAVKNKDLFGDDTDEEEEDDRKKEKQLLVELINIPKDTKDFDKLLPHLKNHTEYCNQKKSIITDEQIAAKEAYKEHKFNVSLGNEQEEKKSTEKSSTFSRDERHAARDKERELANKKVEQEEKKFTEKSSSFSRDERDAARDKERELANKKVEQEEKKFTEKTSSFSRDERDAARDKERELANKKVEHKIENIKDDENTQNKMKKKQSTRKTNGDEETKAEEKRKAKEEKQEPAKEERPNRSRKRIQSSDETEPKDTDGKKANNNSTKEKETKKSKETKKDNNSTKEKETKKQNNSTKETKKSKEAKKENNSTKEKETKKSKETKKEKETKKSKETKKETISTKDEETEKAKETKKDTEKSFVEEELQQTRARRMTRLKSSFVDGKPSTSKEAKAKSKAYEQDEEEEDNLHSIPTQRFARRSTRSRSNSKHNESEDTETSCTTSRKKAAKKTLPNTNKTNSTVSLSTTSNRSVSKIANERKRKADTPSQQATVEGKRLRSTSSQDSSATQHSTLSISTVPSISMTMVQPELFQKLITHSAGLWSVAKNPAESDILVMDKAYRTFKFFLAIARGIPIVTSEWLKKINDTKSLKMAPINDYLFSDAEFEKKHKFSFIKSLQLAGQNKKRLFADYEFLMTSNILPNPTEIKAIIEAAGGCVYLKSPPPARENQKIYLISSLNDKKDWHKFRRLNKNIVIISTEAIMSAVMRQHCLPLSNTKNILA